MELELGSSIFTSKPLSIKPPTHINFMLFPSGHTSSCWPGWTLLNIGNHMRNSISMWYGCKPSKLSKRGLRPNVTEFCKQHFVFINIKQLFVDTKYSHRNRCYYHRHKYPHKWNKIYIFCVTFFYITRRIHYIELGELLIST